MLCGLLPSQIGVVENKNIFLLPKLKQQGEKKYESFNFKAHHYKWRKSAFIKEIQEAFQKSYENEFGEFEKTILPVEDIEESFDTKGAESYIAEVNGKRVGSTIIVIDDKLGYSSLHLLYVKSDLQNAGYGYKIWRAIEELHPKTKIWETHTPYYDKRNIHFYVNRCGFKIVEFFNSKHQDPHQTGDTAGNIPSENNLFFRFEKEMK